jgi:hypothetical protein
MPQKPYEAVSRPRDSSSYPPMPAGLPSNRQIKDASHHFQGKKTVSRNSQSKNSTESPWASTVNTNSSLLADPKAVAIAAATRSLDKARWTRKESGNRKNFGDGVWEVENGEPPQRKYDTDVASYLREVRDAEHTHRDQLLGHKRQLFENRVHDHERKVDRSHGAEERLLHGMQQRTRVGKNSVAYNLINHTYDHGSAGTQLSQHDNQEKVESYLNFSFLVRSSQQKNVTQKGADGSARAPHVPALQLFVQPNHRRGEPVLRTAQVMHSIHKTNLD